MQGYQGVPPCPATLNPATWMLDISTAGEEERMGINWADIYDKSPLCKWVHVAAHEASCAHVLPSISSTFWRLPSISYTFFPPTHSCSQGR